MDADGQQWDVIVVGGGAAGLAGALALVRSRRSVLVVDAGEPRNAPAGHVHNFLTRDGTPPAELLAAGRAEVESYGGSVVTGRVRSVAGRGRRLRRAPRGRSPVPLHARRVLVTTGLTDHLPEVPGLAERWGRDVLHCPYCHGWEVRDQAIGVLNSPMAVHQALLFRQLSDDVVLFLHTAPEPADEDRDRLAGRGIRLVAGEVVGAGGARRRPARRTPGVRRGGRPTGAGRVAPLRAPTPVCWRRSGWSRSTWSSATRCSASTCRVIRRAERRLYPGSTWPGTSPTPWRR